MKYRSLELREDNKIICCINIKVNGYDNLEKDVYNFILKMSEEKNIINSKKLLNLLKIKHGITLSDTINVFTDNKNWRINRNTVETLQK